MASQSTIRSTAVLSVLSYARFGLSVLVQILLARLVTPTEFGTVTLASSILAMMSLVGMWGIDKAVMQAPSPKPDEIDHFASTAYTLRLLYGVLFVVVGWGLTLILNRYYSSDIILILRFLIVANGLSVIGQVHSAVALRNGRLAQVGVVEFVGMFIAAAIGIGIAWSGRGLLGLALFTGLRTANVGLGYLMISGFRPKWRIDREEARRIWYFCRETFGSEMIAQFVYQNGDDLIVGSIAGTTQLGLYAISFRLSKLWHIFILQPVMRVLIPNLAKVRNNRQQLARNYAFIGRNMARIVIPINLFLAIVAPEIILVLFGEQWLGAALLFRIQALYAILTQLYQIDFQLFYGMGQPRVVLRLQLVTLIMFLSIGIPMTVAFDTIGMVIAMSIIAIITFVMSNRQVHKELGESLWRISLGSMLAAVFASGVTIGVREVIQPELALLTISILATTYALVYIPLLLAFDRGTAKSDIAFIWRSIIHRDAIAIAPPT